jgi:predicted DNA-binding transcriptional regulator AlpA
MSLMHSETMRPPQAADYVGLSRSTLAKRRLTGDGPKFIRLSPRAIAYLRTDLDDWLKAKRCSSTSEYHVTTRR